MGTINISADGVAVIIDNQAAIMLENNEKYQLDEGMKVMIDDKEATIMGIDHNEFGNAVGHAAVEKSDGSYVVSIIVKSAHPFELLFGV